MGSVFDSITLHCAPILLLLVTLRFPGQQLQQLSPTRNHDGCPVTSPREIQLVCLQTEYTTSQHTHPRQNRQRRDCVGPNVTWTV
ncbi:hypothetical protein B0T13DRAFT_458383, partial [Neurospora crassa]